jgi:hypothetical protein
VRRPRATNRGSLRSGDDWEQAAESYDEAEETEDFQAVSMKCRETLIQFVRALAKAEMVSEGEEAPKRGDVVGWSSLIAITLRPVTATPTSVDI